MKILFISVCAGLVSSFTLFLREAVRWVGDIPKPYDSEQEEDDG